MPIRLVQCGQKTKRVMTFLLLLVSFLVLVATKKRPCEATIIVIIEMKWPLDVIATLSNPR